MKYTSTRKATFIKRPNRFIAHVLLEGDEEIVHVKNTGRCQEILTEGTTVILEKAAPGSSRKTDYSLIAAYKKDRLINIDSQVPNQVVFDALQDKKIPGFKYFTEHKREVTYGNSRFDIYLKKEKQRAFIEVKGVTLEKENTAMFPDAPTSRGTKHIKEMIKAVNEGYKGCIFFLVQMADVTAFTPHTEMDPEFSAALKEAAARGVDILTYDTYVSENEIRLKSKIPVNI
ncbi:MAG: DNA/RNA nuclease SfsA [Halanaerobiales bacterium]